jgi:transposase-like protein
LASATARRYGISPGQLFTWRRELRVQPERPAIEPPQMVRVSVEDGPKANGSSAAVEIILPSEVRLVVAPDIDPAALRRILTVLDSR